MRQQNNGRRRQNRGSNRRSYGATNGHLNKNTVLDSSGPDGRQRGSVSQLNEKYTSLAADAAASAARASPRAAAATRRCSCCASTVWRWPSA